MTDTAPETREGELYDGPVRGMVYALPITLALWAPVIVLAVRA